MSKNQTVYRSKRDAPPAPKSKSKSKLVWCALLAVFTAILYSTCTVLDSIKDRWYVFDPETLHGIARDSVTAHGENASTEAIVNDVISRIREKYPSHVLNPDTHEWVFNNAAGAMGAMTIIHASITEYVIIFGSALGTEGHTGRHTSDDYFNILTGEEWAWAAGSFKKEVYPPGSVHHLRRGDVKQYRMPDECFALEYARGWIPPMLPMGLADTFSSTMDIITLYHTIRITLREMLKNLWYGKI